MSRPSPQSVCVLASTLALVVLCRCLPPREVASSRAAVIATVPVTARETLPSQGVAGVAAAGGAGLFAGADLFAGDAPGFSPSRATSVSGVFGLPVGALASVRPVGAPRYLPGDFSGATGVTGGVGFALDPVSRWRLGLDLVVRADHPDEHYRPQTLDTFVVPGVEYMLNPQSDAPVTMGVIAPVSLGDSPAGSGVFFFVRWDEFWGKPARRR